MAATGKRIVVLGAGLSGLSFVHYLRNFVLAFQRTDLVGQIIVVEADEQVGGSVRSIVHDDGIVHELGPRNFRTLGGHCTNFAALVGHLGMGDLLNPFPLSMVQKHQLLAYDADRLFPVPQSTGHLLAKLPNSRHRVFEAIFRDIVWAKRMDISKFPDQDPPLYDFIKHRFGEPVAEKIGDPLISMILAGDIRKLSTEALVGDFLVSEQKFNSVIRGSSMAPTNLQAKDELFEADMTGSELIAELRKKQISLYNLKPGNQAIADRLCATLLGSNEDKSVSIYNQTEAISIRFKNSEEETDWLDSDEPKAPCSVLVHTVDGENIRIDCDHLVSSLPAAKLANLLEGSMPANYLAQLDDLKRFENAPVASVCLEYRNLKPTEVNSQVLEAAAVAVNSKSDCRLLSLSLDFNRHLGDSNENKLKATKVNCSIGGAFFEKAFGSQKPDQIDAAQMEQIALEEVSKLLETRREPYRVSSMMQLDSNSQYRPGHKTRLERLRAAIEANGIPLSLLGLSYDGVTPAEAVMGARMGANRLLKRLELPVGRDGSRELGQAPAHRQLAADDQSPKAEA